MKSIQNQYRDLKEGRMSQSNFMRNLRMTMPQYVTNVTSFNDAVKILKNKAILSENMDPSEDEEIETIIKKMEDEMGGEDEVKGKYDLEEDQLNEGKGKDLHPNQIHPSELRMGIKVELEHTDDLDKAKKIALDHLAENPFYYTALKLSGIESPSKPKIKAPKEKKAKKRETKPELIDKDNQMKKVKIEKKKLKEANFNLLPDEEPNTAAKQAMQFVNGNAILKSLSDDIEIQQSGEDAILRFRYWDELPSEAIEKLKLQFDVEVMKDFDEDTGEIIAYRLTPLRKDLGSKDLGASFEKFKSQLEQIVREVIAEMQSNEQETDTIAMSMDETFDGRDNLDAENID